MSKAGDVFNNAVTGEYGYVRLGTEETNGERMVVDLRARPGGASLGPHLHSEVDERFTVLAGKIGYFVGDKNGTLQAGETADLPRGIPHDWWNAGDEEARVIVEIWPAARFEQMAITTFGLARDGKTNKKGMPNLFQLAVISKEFEDVLQVMNPPLWVQRVLFAVVVPIASLLGYKASYPHHLEMARAMETVEVEPLPAGIMIAGT
jgi:quercetin dioxygenase-like cupin family protein